MTQEDKELLLKDLCARLPYGVKTFTYIPHLEGGGETIERTLDSMDIDKLYGASLYPNEKPYLRPMSSMTDDEKEELKEEHKKDERIYIDVIERVANGDKHARGTAVPHFAADWCNEHHFDYRGLIERGLAIAVTEKNNPYEN